MKNIVAILIILISIKSYGQTELDTIKFKTIETRIINSIESLGMKIIDTLSKPNSFILSNENNPEIIAIKKGCKFLVFDLIPNDLDYGIITNIQRIQVNGKNHKELVVYWSSLTGHSGLGGGLRQEFRGIIIYDLKKLLLVFDKEYYFSNYTWSNDISDDLEVASTSESTECDNFDIQFSNKEIIMELKTSKECDSINFLDFNITKWNYKLKHKSFIGKGIKTTGNTVYN